MCFLHFSSSYIQVRVIFEFAVFTRLYGTPKMLDFFFLCLLYLTTVIFLASMGLNDNPLDYSVVSNQMFEVRASLFQGFEQAERFVSQSLFSEGSVIKSVFSDSRVRTYI